MSKSIQIQVSCLIGSDYPAPVVDHTSAIKLARKKIGERRKQANFNSAAQQVYQKLGSRKRTNRTNKGSNSKTKRSTTSNNSAQLKLL